LLCLLLSFYSTISCCCAVEGTTVRQNMTPHSIPPRPDQLRISTVPFYTSPSLQFFRNASSCFLVRSMHAFAHQHNASSAKHAPFQIQTVDQQVENSFITFPSSLLPYRSDPTQPGQLHQPPFKACRCCPCRQKAIKIPPSSQSSRHDIHGMKAMARRALYDRALFSKATRISQSSMGRRASKEKEEKQKQKHRDDKAWKREA